MADTHCRAIFPGPVEAVGMIEEMDQAEAKEILAIWRSQAPIILAITRILKKEDRSA
jgi:hypothetical protein